VEVERLARSPSWHEALCGAYNILDDIFYLTVLVSVTNCESMPGASRAVRFQSGTPAPLDAPSGLVA
jgi:hypothetical protein